VNDSWIKLHRKFLEWEWFETPEMVKLFIYILLKVNFRGKKWKGISVKRGQLITGRKQLSNDLNMSEQKIRTCMNKLKSTNEITIKTTNKYSVITVTNYDSYNVLNDSKQPTNNQQPNQQTTNKQPTNNQQLTTTKNNKKEKNVKNKNEFDLIFDEFSKMRVKIRKPLTDKARELILGKLDKLANDEKTKIKILEQSIMNSWQGVFPLKEDEKKSSGKYRDQSNDYSEQYPSIKK
jgi:predicted peptidase